LRPRLKIWAWVSIAGSGRCARAGQPAAVLTAAMPADPINISRRVIPARRKRFFGRLSRGGISQIGIAGSKEAAGQASTSEIIILYCA
jgi:hypothetical protein